MALPLPASAAHVCRARVVDRDCGRGRRGERNPGKTARARLSPHHTLHTTKLTLRCTSTRRWRFVEIRGNVLYSPKISLPPRTPGRVRF
ncbi:hypothetical protein IF1G_09500 [Cordyceps javanica]|uniref:Uncharacterized protein n=1 Tax=Cordyceps javanica TaxID=43265 RepID=A0A545UR27_9HYPO|nr:hypothetical protein IF1G_09500 [Cordyceps javanica]